MERFSAATGGGCWPIAAGSRSTGATSTVTLAVGPDGSTANPLAAAVASFRYSPAAFATVTPKWRLRLPPAGTIPGAFQRSSRPPPETVGSAGTAPLVLPGL